MSTRNKSPPRHSSEGHLPLFLWQVSDSETPLHFVVAMTTLSYLDQLSLYRPSTRIRKLATIWAAQARRTQSRTGLLDRT